MKPGRKPTGAPRKAGSGTLRKTGSFDASRGKPAAGAPERPRGNRVTDGVKKPWKKPGGAVEARGKGPKREDRDDRNREGGRNGGKAADHRRDESRPFNPRGEEGGASGQRRNDSKPFAPRSRDGKPSEHRRPESRPFKPRGDEGDAPQQRRHEGKPFEPRSRDGKPPRQHDNERAGKPAPTQTHEFAPRRDAPRPAPQFSSRSPVAPDTGFRPYLLTAAQEALHAMLRFDQPGDAILTAYFRSHSKLGQRDRAFVAEAAFGVLRHRSTLEAISPRRDPRALVIAWLARFGGRNLRELATVLSEEETQVYTTVRAAAMDALPLHCRAELPEWVVERLATIMTEAEVLELGRALQASAPLDLRVNTLRAKREDVLEKLAQSGIRAEPTECSPIGIRVAEHPAINRHPAFLEGEIEVQDEGSQLIGYLVAPKRTDLVIDFCSGAGGKALMLGALMQSKGRLYAFDVSSARISRLTPRLRRSGLSNLHPEVIASENDTRVKRLAGKVDRVLVDAPCSGFGTLRRNPDLRYRHTPATVAELVVKQRAILKAAARLVKPGGRLVYATCSLLPEENRAIVEDFLAQDASFELVDARDVLKRAGIAIPALEGPYLQLWPHRHPTDGFFAAVLDRRNAPAAAHATPGEAS